MDSVPSITSSILDGMRTGFGTLDRGAAELVDGTLSDSDDETSSPAATVSTGNPITSADASAPDEVLSGVRDLMFARLQIGASAALLHAYNNDRNSLFEMLR